MTESLRVVVLLLGVFQCQEQAFQLEQYVIILGDGYHVLDL